MVLIKQGMLRYGELLLQLAPPSETVTSFPCNVPTLLHESNGAFLHWILYYMHMLISILKYIVNSTIC